jgi:hypothetical protein
MSEFGGKADVQQIRVIALMMITVLPGSATKRHSLPSCEGLSNSNNGRSRHAISTTEYGQQQTISAMKNGNPKAAAIGTTVTITPLSFL